MPPQKKTSPPTSQTTTLQAEAHTTQQAQTEPTALQTTARPLQAQAETTTARAPSNWYTDTLRTIVNRALDADKPDIKGALAALAMLAEAEEPAEDTGDIATLLRDARKRAAHARENTD